MEAHFTGQLLLAIASRQVHVRHNVHVHANVKIQLSSKSTSSHTVASCLEQWVHHKVLAAPTTARNATGGKDRCQGRSAASKRQASQTNQELQQLVRPSSRHSLLFSTQSEPPDCRGHDLHNLRKTARSPSTVTARLNLGTRWRRWRGASEAQGFANLRFHRFGPRREVPEGCGIDVHTFNVHPLRRCSSPVSTCLL